MNQKPETPFQQRRRLARAARGHGVPCVHPVRNVSRIVAATALILLALTALPWGGAIAHAHARLISSDPVSGAVLTAAPETLRLTFNENVTLLETTRLTGPEGPSAYTATVDDGLVELRPTATLPDGRWTITWQVVSADGHLVGGVIPFTVGTAVADDAASADAAAYTVVDYSNPMGGTGALDRILELLGWLAVIGALGALISGRPTPATWLAATAVLAPTLRVVDTIDRLGESAWVIGETRAALAAALAGVLLLTAKFSEGRTRTSLTIAAVLAWAAQALLSGHPNVLDPEPLYALLSALHLAGALTWSATVTAVLLNPECAKRASRTATIGITLLLPGALLLVGAFLPAALEHGAGRWETILGAKAVLVLGALLLGWKNHRDVRRGDLSALPSPRLRRRAKIEIALITLVAVLSATLTTAVPARVLHAGTPGAADTGTRDEDGETSTSTDTPAERATVNAELVFENGETGELLLEIDTDGTTTIHLVLRDETGNPFTAEQVEYELENVEAGLSGVGGTLPVSGGMHMGETALPVGGRWRISVNATYDTFTTITATTEIETPETRR